jgi:membrane-bound lytic murein transglycosylase B
LENRTLKPTIYSPLLLLAFLAALPGPAQTLSAQAKAGAIPTELPEFSANPNVADFIVSISAKHGMDAEYLAELFASIRPNMRVLALFAPSPLKTPLPPSWKRYSAQFLSKARIDAGATFWAQNKETLDSAFRQFGVPQEIIVAIIGVETYYGRHTGNFGVMEALATLAFHEPRRAEFFRGELEHFLLLARENGFDPLKTKGSYAGAIGIPQFMPGSWRKFAIDFDRDGIIDLENSVADSIGSVASYLSMHGWQKGEPIVHKIKLRDKPKADWANAGMLPSLDTRELANQGVPVPKGAPDLATFISLPTPGQQTEHWLGYGNYYSITRYNRSTFYSMSVVRLAMAIKAQAGR